MLLTMGDGSNTSQVTSADDHDKAASVEGNNIDDLAGGDVQLDAVMSLDDWVGIADGTSVMSDQVRHTSGADSHAADTAQLELGLLGADAVDGEAALHVKDKTEVLTSLLDGDNVHKASWESSISADFSVDLDKTLLNNLLHFVSSECILESVSQEDDERKTFPHFVWTSGWLRGKCARKLVQHP